MIRFNWFFFLIIFWKHSSLVWVFRKKEQVSAQDLSFSFLKQKKVSWTWIQSTRCSFAPSSQWNTKSQLTVADRTIVTNGSNQKRCISPRHKFSQWVCSGGMMNVSPTTCLISVARPSLFSLLRLHSADSWQTASVSRLVFDRIVRHKVGSGRRWVVVRFNLASKRPGSVDLVFYMIWSRRKGGLEWVTRPTAIDASHRSSPKNRWRLRGENILGVFIFRFDKINNSIEIGKRVEDRYLERLQRHVPSTKWN